ncbi:MAG: hypothetical protein IJ157_06035 [Clostridia bacterium]|nr:hypothetical protein [Clostridia bacterium]
MIELDDFLTRGEAVAALIGDVRSGRASHATALMGMAGVGKRTLARLIACAYLCVGPGVKPCMQCKGCKRAMNGTHPDLLTPSAGEKERSIKVDHLREIIHALSMHAVEGGQRVVLLENAQRMTPQAQNALLKSLEEPDGSTRFILTASGDAGLLSTVRSRCRVVRVPPWPRQEIEDALKERGADAAQARELSILCGGSLGLALSMREDPAFLQVRTLCEQTFFSLRSARDVPGASAMLKDKREDAGELLSILEQRVREYLLFSMGARPAPQAAAETACHESWLHASPRALENVLTAIIEANRYRASNVSWQAVAERLLYIISEEIILWQP